MAEGRKKRRTTAEAEAPLLEWLRTVGAHLAEVREERGLTRYRVSKLTGVSETQLKHLEGGGNASLLLLAKVAHALGLELKIGQTRAAPDLSSERVATASDQIEQGLDLIEKGLGSLRGSRRRR